MSKKKILYEGKAKTILEGPTSDTVIQYFKDDATANNAEKHSIINGKGVLNNSISDFLMKKINEIGIPTHYIKKLNMREQLVRKVEIIPVEFVVRNIAAGSIVKRLGLKEGKIFSRPLIEHYLKKDELGDPLINEDHIVNFEWGTRDELDEMNTFLAKERAFNFKMALINSVKEKTGEKIEIKELTPINHRGQEGKRGGKYRSMILKSNTSYI